MQQRGDVTADLTLSVGGIEETVTVEAPPVKVQFNTSSSDITLERQLIDQVPIAGRNPYNLASLDPTITATLSNENRPYHHAYANDYDAGGGTRRANDVLLDGVPLGASYKTAYTPAVDAVEEITVSKNSVDAENGHSLGGVISLNMKSGTNEFHGSSYYYSRDPSMNSIERSDNQNHSGAGHAAAPWHRAQHVRRHARRSAQAQQDLQLHVVRAVGRQAAALDRPHGADRAGTPGRLQPVDVERARADDLQPVRLDASIRRRAASSVRPSPAT